MEVKTPDEFSGIYIEQPEFKYIFTIDLKGRLVNLFDNLKSELFVKESDIDLGKGGEQVYASKMDECFVQYYVDKYLLNHATPVRWILSKTSQDTILNDALLEFGGNIKCNDCDNKKRCNLEYLKFNNSASKEISLINIGGSPVYSHLIAGIEIKLFSQGTLSILLRFKSNKPKVLISDCANYIRYPENIIILTGECYLGPLNKYAFIVARKALEKLINDEGYKENFEDKLKNSYTTLDKKNSLDAVLKENVDDFERKAQLYVGMFCQRILSKTVYKSDFQDKNLVTKLLNQTIIEEDGNNPKIVCFGDSANDENLLKEKLKRQQQLNDKAKTLILTIWQHSKDGNMVRWPTKEEREKGEFLAQKAFISLANNTPEFLKSFQNADQYILDNNIARGEEIILVERRGWLLASQRLDEEKENRYRFGIVESLLYSIETQRCPVRKLHTG